MTFGGATTYVGGHRQPKGPTGKPARTQCMADGCTHETVVYICSSCLRAGWRIRFTGRGADRRLEAYYADPHQTDLLGGNR